MDLPHFGKYSNYEVKIFLSETLDTLGYAFLITS